MVLAGSLYFLVSAAQEEIDFNNRQLNKSLRKNGIAVIEEAVDDAGRAGEGGFQISDGKFFSPADENYTGPLHLIYVGRVRSCRASGCAMDQAPAGGKAFEYFDYFMFLDSVSAIQKIEVFNYRASHGYEITARGWLKQYIGYDGSHDLSVGKDIDAITGATVSVNALTEDVMEKIRMVKTGNQGTK